MENKQIPKEENQIKSSNVQPNIDFEDKMLSKIFCPLCFQFPKYSIKFTSSSNFVLVHECLEGKIIESSIVLEKSSNPPNFNCFYCKKNCELICVRCKYCLCRKCAKKHTRIPEFENILDSQRKSNNNSVINIIKYQYICENHLLEYKFYCPVCNINLCQNCKEQHFHINCPELKNQKFKFEEIYEPLDDCYKKLFMLAKLFYDCYNIKASNDQMTLNILFNTNLADNILTFIRNNMINKIKEIKNNFFNDVDEKLYLCNVNGNSKFEEYFFNLLIKANSGNINAFQTLYGIIEKYERDFKRNIYNKLILRQSYLSSLDFRKDSFINKINFTADKIDLNETNIILANSLKMINDLKLKNEFLDYCLQLVKMIALKMNYKLDLELRRKVGNIMSTIILKNFNKNLEPIQKSKKMLLYSSEYFKEKIKSNSQTKNYKNKVEEKKEFESLKSKYKLTLTMLINEIKEELKKIEKENSILFSKENLNIIRFKNLDETREEINKAVICNLFFTIKWKLGDEFNQQIHNVTHSIDSLLVNEIKSLENKIKEENSINDEEIEKENSDSIILENKEGKDEIENKKKLKKINKTCPKKYQFLELLNNLQVEKKKKELFDAVLNVEDDPIIDSTIDEFVKILNDISITYSISSNISIKDSLDLYFNGKKGNILKKDKLSEKLENLMKNIKTITKGDKSEIDQILNLAEKIKNQLETNFEFLSRFMGNILQELEKLWNRFNIDELFLKYNIKTPSNPLKDIYQFQFEDQEGNEDIEEIYFLALVLGYLFIKPKIKEIQRLNDDFQQIDLKEITKNNILKRNIIKQLKENNGDFDMNSLISNVWEKLGKNETFVEDKKMNNLMKNYIQNRTEGDFKSDLISLIKPYSKGIDLNGRDPQNITVEPFMIQNNLINP